MYYYKKKSTAFTLIELLTVIAVISIIAAILIPAVGKARLSAQSATSVSNLRQLGTAIMMHMNENEGRYPSAYWAAEDGWHKTIYERVYEVQWQEYGTPSQPLLPNSIFWSPTVDSSLYQKMDDSTGKLRRFCYGMNNYFMNFGEAPTSDNGPKGTDGVISLKIHDPAQTCLLGDTIGGMNLAPAQLSFPNAGGTSNILFFDGHVETLTPDELPLKWTGPAADGNKIGEVFWRGGPVGGRIPKT